MDNDSTARSDADGELPTPGASMPASMHRRQALLNGLSKGGAALGALTVPVLARADAGLGLVSPEPPPTATGFPNYKTPNGMLCTVSGQQSAVMSRAAKDWSECGGKPPSHYVQGSGVNAQMSNWPNLSPANRDLLTFGQLYPGTTSPKSNMYLLQILGNAVSSDEAHWIAAYFNALMYKQTGKPAFPFTTSELREKHNSPTEAAKYIDFFIKFNLA